MVAIDCRDLEGIKLCMLSFAGGCAGETKTRNNLVLFALNLMFEFNVCTMQARSHLGDGANKTERPC